MASLSFFIGIIGNVISLLLFASPIITFWRVVKKKSTENYEGVAYITTLMNTSLWTFYGLTKPDGLLIYAVNGAGSVLQLTYVTLFLIYAPRHKKIKMAKLAAIFDVGFLGTVIAVTLLAFHRLSLRLTFVGIIGATLTVGMYASPLLIMTTVIKTKSVEYMPFWLSLFLFLNAGVWSIYSVLVKDIYIGVPNSIGFVLGSAQLIIYVIYKNKSKSTKPPEVMEEEGSIHLVKRCIEMQAYDHDDNDNFEDDDFNDDTKVNNRSLNKVKSLPKHSFKRQHSLKKFAKTLSLGPYDTCPTWSDDATSDHKRNIHDVPLIF
ncbi:hypothetical protein ACOSQ4_009024 [Xanthoceras sorbifolium]